MSDEIVRIKGTKSGLQLLFAAGATYAAIEEENPREAQGGLGILLPRHGHACNGGLALERRNGKAQEALP